MCSDERESFERKVLEKKVQCVFLYLLLVQQSQMKQIFKGTLKGEAKGY